jgi:peptidoglycan hydrolase-like protein with peptidoglycan-binding domain
LRFTPAKTAFPLTVVTVTVAGGSAGPISTTHEVLAAPVIWSYTIAPGSTLRLQQLLAELGYLPLTFVADAVNPEGARTAAAGFSDAPSGTSGASTAPRPASSLDQEPSEPSQISLAPLPGSLRWRFRSIPPQLRATFSAGQWGAATLGAVVAFQADHHLELDGSAGPAVWAALLDAVATRQATTRPYDYILVTETEPETLYVWREGAVVLQTPVNTGVRGAPTAEGTWPVYLRYTTTTMTGVNPDGSHYSDPGVPWVSYFNGSEAVHGFARPGYGYPQSVGCVEVPISTAEAIYPLDPYGTLVTVTSGNLAGELDVAPPRYILPTPPTSTTAVPTSTTLPATTAG